eukprot:3363348-Rhodomonas_salina.2
MPLRSTTLHVTTRHRTAGAKDEGSGNQEWRNPSAIPRTSWAVSPSALPPIAPPAPPWPPPLAPLPCPLTLLLPRPRALLPAPPAPPAPPCAGAEGDAPKMSPLCTGTPCQYQDIAQPAHRLIAGVA